MNTVSAEDVNRGNHWVDDQVQKILPSVVLLKARPKIRLTAIEPVGSHLGEELWHR